MKKLSVVTFGIILFSLTACKDNGAGGMSEKAKKNLDASRAVVAMFESHDYSKMGDYIATDVVDHSGMSGETKGLDSLRASFKAMEGMMKDVKNETVKEVADDDYVFQWLKETSTMTVDEMGMKAGSTNTFNTVEVSKFNADGKITDHWSFMSGADVMKMMPQQTMPMMDTSKKK